jgi:hypothetical protein
MIYISYSIGPKRGGTVVERYSTNPDIKGLNPAAAENQYFTLGNLKTWRIPLKANTKIRLKQDSCLKHV